MKISIAALIVCLAVAASSVQALDQRCYRDCKKMGESDYYCRISCGTLDSKCYRDCKKMGESDYYCKGACTK
ncbi:hypothetical protein BGZ92_002102 [Podila epicladia]|nr:hypothetical protein BGZ92_002102 [Podila epicladia]